MNLLQYLKSKEFLRTIILVIAISMILLFGLFKWLHQHTKQDEKIEVPNLEMLSWLPHLKVFHCTRLPFLKVHP